MAYNSAIPQATDALATSQADILNNFAAINSYVNINHVPFNTADSGKHTQITFPSGAQPGQPYAYLAGEIGLQSLNLAPSNVPDIWMARGVAAAFPITGKLSNATDGWSYLPSGILIKWGARTALGAGNTAATYAVGAGYPVFNNVYAVFITPTSNITVYSNGLTVLAATVNTSAAGTFNFMVIGD